MYNVLADHQIDQFQFSLNSLGFLDSRIPREAKGDVFKHVFWYLKPSSNSPFLKNHDETQQSQNPEQL